MTKYTGLSQTHLDIFIFFVKILFSFLQIFIIYEDNVLEYIDKNYAAKGGGVTKRVTKQKL